MFFRQEGISERTETGRAGPPNDPARHFLARRCPAPALQEEQGPSLLRRRTGRTTSSIYLYWPLAPLNRPCR